MTTTLAPGRMTVDEYFALEMATEYPNEYRAGEVVPIDRSSYSVSSIKTDTLAWLHPISHARDIEPYYSFRVRIPALDAYVYPDISVVIGTGRFESHGETDTLLDPVLVIDVLSDRPAHADPGWRARAYCTVDSIREYVRIASDRPYVTVFRRADDGSWTLAQEAAGLEAEFTMESIGITLAMEKVYRRAAKRFREDAPATPEGTAGADHD